jgi:hypothetical protein
MTPLSPQQAQLCALAVTYAWPSSGQCREPWRASAGPYELATPRPVVLAGEEAGLSRFLRDQGIEESRRVPPGTAPSVVVSGGTLVSIAPDVYFGEDGVRFADGIRRAHPAGTALDVGCGAGAGTVALAESCAKVTAVDVLAACTAATRRTATLSGVADRVDTITADFRDLPTGAFDCVAANLPGVPIPPALAYASTGNGGPDGLTMTRALLDRAPRWWTDATISTPRLILRLQSHGDHERPRILGELTSFAVEHRLDTLVVVDSRCPAVARSALTARYAARANGSGVDRLLALCEDHAAKIGMADYYSAAVWAWDGTGSVHYLDVAVPDRLHRRVRVETDVRRAAPAIQRRFRSMVDRLPMGYWELAGHEVLEQTQRLAADPDFAAAVNDAESLWAAASGLPAEDRGGYAMTINLLADCLIALDLAREEGPL